MNSDESIPPLRDLPPSRLVERRRHLMAEISARRRPPSRRFVLAFALLLVIATATWGAVAATTANGTQPGHPVPAGLAAAHVSAAGYAGSSGVWAITPQGLKLSTQAGSWTDVTPSDVQPGLITSAYLADPSNGWVAAYGETNSNGAPLLVYRTTDGGSSWQATTVDTSPLLAQSEQGSSSLTFANATDGWLEVQTVSSSNFSNANLYRTTDGGATWTAEQIPIAGPLTFTSAKTGFVSGGAGGTDLYGTQDGGLSWQPISLSGPSGTVYGPTFTTPTDGLVTVTTSTGNATTAHIYRTTDGGATWTETDTVSEAAGAGGPTPVATVDGGWLAAIGPGGAFARKAPGGSPSPFSASGLPSRDLAQVASLDFNDGSENGLAVVNGGTCEGYKVGCIQFGALYSTSDGGSTWSQLTP